jgi:hypothetical protein
VKDHGKRRTCCLWHTSAVPLLKTWGEVAADLLKRLDMKVDFAAVGWGTVMAQA